MEDSNGFRSDSDSDQPIKRKIDQVPKIVTKKFRVNNSDGRTPVPVALSRQNERASNNNEWTPIRVANCRPIAGAISNSKSHIPFTKNKLLDTHPSTFRDDVSISHLSDADMLEKCLDEEVNAFNSDVACDEDGNEFQVLGSGPGTS